MHMYRTSWCCMFCWGLSSRISVTIKWSLQNNSFEEYVGLNLSNAMTKLGIVADDQGILGSDYKDSSFLKVRARCLIIRNIFLYPCEYGNTSRHFFNHFNYVYFWTCYISPSIIFPTLFSLVYFQNFVYPVEKKFQPQIGLNIECIDSFPAGWRFMSSICYWFPIWYLTCMTLA